MIKKVLTAIVCTFIATHAVQADEVIAHWNFNSTPPDGKIPTGSVAPTSGRGRLALVGGVKRSFAPGFPADLSPDNTALSTTSYPAPGTANKSAGVEFYVSTKGYYNIGISLQAKASPLATYLVRLQYTLDGTNFLDSIPLIVGPADEYTIQTNNFWLTWQCNDNTNFGFRVVAEWYFTATGKEPHDFVTSTSYPYSPSGTLHYDEVYVWGQELTADPVPQATFPMDVTTTENVPVVGMRFDVADDITAASNLVVVAHSSNETLLPNENILLGGGGTNRTLTLTPARNQAGVTTITIDVSNESGRFIRRSFRLFVTPAGAPPVVRPISNQVALINTTVTVPFTIESFEGTEGPFFICEASNSPLIPASQMWVTGGGTNWVLNMVPATNHIGSSLITVYMSDSHRTGSNSFVLVVRPSTNVLVCDSFDYRVGSIITNSHYYWTTHSGATGQISTTEAQLWMVGTSTEDVNVPLLGAPYSAGSGAVLYSAFDLNLRNLPSAAGQFFAHYNNSGFRCRVFVLTSGAATGMYRVGIANNSTDVAALPMDLMTHTSYRVVTRYNVATGESRLWIDPVAETDSSVVATDAPSPATITTFAFRQNTGIALMTVDDLKVGRSFDSVALRSRPTLVIRGERNHAETTWIGDLTGYVLEESDSLVTPNWIPLRGEPAETIYGRRMVQWIDTVGNRFFRLRATNAPPATP